ncbi:hypothetical protein [Haloprofundus halobius]|uniref:hypothetical protein n=1 Tax=Haloprofundus halobius TaxID=2876194 RepID=UPI001CCC205E|nr:hypothetical protein [Haloprofundus halobius]
MLAVDHSALAGVVVDVKASFEELQTALGALATEDVEYAQYHAKELTNLIYDVTTAVLLVSRADDELADGNARLALVAEAFVAEHLRIEPARGITSGGTFCAQHFDALARYAAVDPSVLDEPPAQTGD